MSHLVEPSGLGAARPFGVRHRPLGEFFRQGRRDLADRRDQAAGRGAASRRATSTTARSRPSTSMGNETGELLTRSIALGASFATTFGPSIRTAGVTYRLYQSRNDCSGLCENQDIAQLHDERRRRGSAAAGPFPERPLRIGARSPKSWPEAAGEGQATGGCIADAAAYQARRSIRQFKRHGARRSSSERRRKWSRRSDLTTSELHVGWRGGVCERDRRG